MKDLLYAPLEIMELLKDDFGYPETTLFGSVATIKNDSPALRTMRIYEFNQNGSPILLTHTGSHKWKEWLHYPKVSISLVHENRLLQILASGHVILETALSAEEKGKQYWDMIRPDVKKIYDPKHKIEQLYQEEELHIPSEVPQTLGIACLIPTFWEMLCLKSEYTKSYRSQFHWKDGSWQKQRIHVG